MINPGAVLYDQICNVGRKRLDSWMGVVIQVGVIILVLGWLICAEVRYNNRNFLHLGHQRVLF